MIGRFRQLSEPRLRWQAGIEKSQTPVERDILIQWMCIPILERRSPSSSAVRNHCRSHPVPCVGPRCVCSVLHAHVQFCRFDKADATADVQWHCIHRPPLWYHYFPAQSSLGADILVYWIGKIVRTCAPPPPRLPARKASTLSACPIRDIPEDHNTLRERDIRFNRK